APRRLGEVRGGSVVATDSTTLHQAMPDRRQEGGWAGPTQALSMDSISDFAENGLVKKTMHPDWIAAMRVSWSSRAVIKITGNVVTACASHRRNSMPDASPRLASRMTQQA